MKNNRTAVHKEIDRLNQEAFSLRISDSPGSFAICEQIFELLKKDDYPEGKAAAFKSYGFCLIRLSKNEEAMPYLNESLKIYESLNDIKGLSLINEYFGIVQRNWGNFETSLQFINKALTQSQECGFSENQLTNLYQLGVTYKHLGNYEKALDHLNKSLSIARSINHGLMEAYIVNLIGTIYFETEDYTAALNYYQQGLVVRKESRDKWGEAGSLDNIGYTYHKLQKGKEALEFCSKSLVISESTEDKRGQANVLFHLAEIYHDKREVEKADLYSRKSLQIRKAMGDKRGEAELLLFLAEMIKSDTKNDSERASFLDKALDISSEIHAADLSGKIHFALYENFKHNGQYAKALTHFESYNKIEKELHKDAINQKVLNFDISKRAEESEKEAERFRIKNEELASLNGEIIKQKEEIEQTLHKLRITQSQLVQSEKMASLGELTAGIAHEIQNPLNFVNNFSELNSELIEELKHELKNGNFKEVNAIATDIDANEKKIIFHGKRADGIVKGMLQHSRSSSGTKEPTDINALADEYLRLAYHGFRAKDKSFNVTIKTDFDPGIGKINILPQDIGRVILNLITNAFYVVTKKKASLKGTGTDTSFEPLVVVKTKQVGDKITIGVQDNGFGIPKEIIDKIFQPFFTTKPTGEGTGLGLSMSYDIITQGHDGELKVETEQDAGTTFTIVLPVRK